jgi:hypothetical protein
MQPGFLPKIRVDKFPKQVLNRVASAVQLPDAAVPLLPGTARVSCVCNLPWRIPEPDVLIFVAVIIF